MSSEVGCAGDAQQGPATDASSPEVLPGVQQWLQVCALKPHMYVSLVDTDLEAEVTPSAEFMERVATEQVPFFLHVFLARQLTRYLCLPPRISTSTCIESVSRLRDLNYNCLLLEQTAAERLVAPSSIGCDIGS